MAKRLEGDCIGFHTITLDSSLKGITHGKDVREALKAVIDLPAKEENEGHFVFTYKCDNALVDKAKDKARALGEDLHTLVSREMKKKLHSFDRSIELHREEQEAEIDFRNWKTTGYDLSLTTASSILTDIRSALAEDVHFHVSCAREIAKALSSHEGDFKMILRFQGEPDKYGPELWVDKVDVTVIE